MRYPKSVNGVNRKEWIIMKAISPCSRPRWVHKIKPETFMKEFKYRRVQLRCRYSFQVDYKILIRVYEGSECIFSSQISYDNVSDEISKEHFKRLLSGFFFTFMLNRKDIQKILLARQVMEI